MNKSFVSDIDRWIDIAGAWSNNSKGPSKCFSEGIEAASTINSILYNAPANVGGTIRLGIRMSEVDELLSNWELMQNFSNSIHYEAADLIDIPYTKKVNRVMEDIYGLEELFVLGAWAVTSGTFVKYSDNFFCKSLL